MSFARPDRLQTLSLEEPFYNGIAMSPDAKTIVVSSRQDGIFLVAPETNSVRKTVPRGSTGPLAVSADGKSIASAGGSRSGGVDQYGILVHEVPSGKLRWHRDFPTDMAGNPSYGPLEFSPDATTLFMVLGGHSILQQRDAATGDLLREYAELGPSFSISRDGSLLAVQANESNAFGIDLFETATGQRLGALALKEKPSSPLVFSNRGDLLATCGEAGTVLLWKVFPPPGPADRLLTEMTGQKLWEMLASQDGPTAYAALRFAIADGDRTVALLTSKMPPAERVAAVRIAGWIAQLGSDDFPTRESAFRQLQEVERQAESALLAAAKNSDSPETQKRSKRLLDGLQATQLRPSLLRENRCVMLLEQIDSVSSRSLLESLSKGAGGANRTQSAASAIDRQHSRSRELRHRSE